MSEFFQAAYNDVYASLSSLLAIIHRDNGYHTEAVGYRQSVKDACKICAEVQEIEGRWHAYTRWRWGFTGESPRAFMCISCKNYSEGCESDMDGVCQHQGIRPTTTWLGRPPGIWVPVKRNDGCFDWSKK